MSRALQKLTPKKLESLLDKGRHSDGGGLYLNVSKDGAKSWVFIYTRNGKKREMGLGAYVKSTKLPAKKHHPADTVSLSA